MAESSIFVYVGVMIVFIFFGLLIQKLYQRRLKQEERIYGVFYLIHENRYTVGIFAIMISLYFIVAGLAIMSFSDFLDEYVNQSVKQQKPYYVNNTEIDFRDYEGFKDWLKNAEIHSIDSDPLIIGEERRLQAIIESNKLPKSLVAHIFHEDMMNFFTDDNEPSYYKQQTKTLNRTLSLQYGPMFSIDFDLSSYKECDVEKIEGNVCEYYFQAEEEWIFNTPGKYFVQFTAQLQNGEFDHRLSPLPLTTIMEPHDVWIEEKTLELKISAEKQNVETKNALGLAYLGIGISILFAGITLIVPSVTWKKIIHSSKNDNS